MHVTYPPAPLDIAHDVLDRGKSQFRGRFVVHGQPDPGDDLDHQDQQGQGTEIIPEIEILRGVIAGEVVVPELQQRETRVHPVAQCNKIFNHDCATAESSPTRTLVSLRYWCGGTTRLDGAGTPLNTLPARSNRLPWQGQKKPPFQSVPSWWASPSPFLAYTGGTTQVGADAQHDQVFRALGTVLVPGVERLLFGFRRRVLDFLVQFMEFVYGGIVTAQDPDRSAAPFDYFPFTDLQVADVRLHRRADCPRPGAGRQGGYKRDTGRQGACSACHGRGGGQETAAFDIYIVLHCVQPQTHIGIGDRFQICPLWHRLVHALPDC